MKYTVTWLPPALSELARLWNQASDRQAVTDAANDIDRELSVDPDQKGRTFGRHRIFRAPPLVVVFEVIPDDRLVRILQVYRLP